MLKVFILEDNLQQLAELQTITKQVLAKLNITDSLVFPFSSTSRLTKALPEPSLDNVFILDLSINDNKQAGLQLSQLIRQVDHLATIIFITVHDELLPTTYKYRVQALDFISKDHDNVAHELLTDFHLIAQRKQEAKTDVFSYRIYNQTQTILLTISATSSPTTVIRIPRPFTLSTTEQLKSTRTSTKSARPTSASSGYTAATWLTPSSSLSPSGRSSSSSFFC